MKSLITICLMTLAMTLVQITGPAQAGDRSFEFSITIGGDHHRQEHVEHYVVEEYYRYIDVDIRTNRTYYDFGDGIDLDLRVDEDAYVYLFLKDPHGNMKQLFPNYHDTDNYLRRNRWYSFPGHGYQYTAEGYEGNHEVVAIASTERICHLDGYFAQSSIHNPWPDCPIGIHGIRAEIYGHYEVIVKDHVRHGKPYNRYPDCIRISQSYLPGYGESSKLINFTRPYSRLYIPHYRSSPVEHRVIIRDDHYRPPSRLRYSSRTSYYSHSPKSSYSFSYSSSKHKSDYKSSHSSHNSHNSHHSRSSQGNQGGSYNRSSQGSGYQSHGGGTSSGGGTSTNGGYQSHGGGTAGGGTSGGY